MNYSGLVICFLLFICANSNQDESIINKYAVQEYYWRDYDGTVPKDAVKGGVDKAGRPTYIGQIVHSKTVLHPGQIDPTYKNISYAYDGKARTATKLIKILCSAYPEKFEWISTNTYDIRFLLPNKYLVTAGYSGDYPLLAGRATGRGQKIIGKVTIRQKYEGIGYVENKKPIYEKSFEVLSFNKDLHCYCY